MRLRPHAVLCLAASCASGDGDPPSDPLPSGSEVPLACRGELVIAPLSVDDGRAADPSMGDAPRVIRFVDPTSGCVTDQVFDADREIVFFDAALDAMVSLDSRDAVSGWTVTGADLDWSRSGVRFRVQFGTEAGERRAYFTEAGPGTICNLNVAGPEELFISATSQTPPNP